MLPFVLFPQRRAARVNAMRSANAQCTLDKRHNSWMSVEPISTCKPTTSLKTVLQVFPLTDQDKFRRDIGSPSFKACIKSECSTTFGNVSPDGLQPCGTLRYCFSLNPKVCSLELCEDSLRVWKCTALDAGFLFHPPR